MCTAICYLAIVLLTSLLVNIDNVIIYYDKKAFGLMTEPNLAKYPVYKLSYAVIKNPSSTNNSKIDGFLNVVVLVNNGNKSSYDFTINVHSNNPNPSSFFGNSSGTNVRLGMGMYSVSEVPLKNYIQHYSPDCFGGIMSTIAKKCIITNIYSNSSSFDNYK
jgi:hypothetical protein